MISWRVLSAENLDIGMEGLDPCPLILNNKTYLQSEETFADHLNNNPQTNKSVLADIEDSLKNFIPTYRDILTRKTLPIFSGGVCINNFEVQEAKGENKGVSIDSIVVGEVSFMKGAVLGGLEKEFSPLKNKNARRLEIMKEKEIIVGTSQSVGPKVLRAQKSLARVKK